MSHECMNLRGEKSHEYCRYRTEGILDWAAKNFAGENFTSLLSSPFTLVYTCQIPAIAMVIGLHAMCVQSALPNSPIFHKEPIYGK